MARVKQPRRTRHQGGNAAARPDPDGKKPAPFAPVWSAAARPDPDGKKPAPFAPVWSPADHVRILEGLSTYVDKHGKPPGRSELLTALVNYPLDRAHFTFTQIYEKVRALKGRYFAMRAAGGAGDGATDEEKYKYELSDNIWGNEEAPRPAQPKLPIPEKQPKLPIPEKQDSERRMFPYLSATVCGLAAESGCGMLGAMFKRAFEKLDDEEAAKLESRVKRQKVKAGKLTISRAILANQVLHALIKSKD